jgi:hypothetical protein
MIFLLRNVNDEFAIRRELVKVTVLLNVCSLCSVYSLLYFTQSPFVVYGGFLYFNIILCLGSLYITGYGPIRDSYKPNKIIPFPLNETTIS